MRQFFGILLVMLVGVSNPAVASNVSDSLKLTSKTQLKSLPNLNLKLRYNIRWGVFSLGRLRIEAREDDTSYRMSFDLKTKALTSIFGKTLGYTFTEGVKNTAGHYVARQYHSWNKSRHKRTVKMTYDNAGKLVSRDRNPLDDPHWRAEVALNSLHNSFDPVTALLVLRQRLLHSRSTYQAETKIRAYDGRRLAEFTLSLATPETKSAVSELTIHGQRIPVIETRITRKPLEGYTPKELKKFKKGDPIVRGYFANNAQLFPVAIKVDLLIGALNITIDEDSLPQLLGTQR